MANTVAALIKRYGTPKAGNAFESKVLTLWDVPQWLNNAFPCLPNKIYCNKDIVVPLEAVLNDLNEAFRNQELQPLDSLLTWDGCFNIRKKRGLKSVSTHAWGLAIDINAFRNQLGKEPTFSDAFVQIWERHGFLWGGRWQRKDGMHFEYNTALL